MLQKESIQKIEDILKSAVRNDNYDIIKQQLSFEERKNIVMNSKQFEILDLFSSNIYLNLFTEEEAHQIYQEVTDNIKSDILLSCSDSFKIKEITNFNGHAPSLLASFADDNKMRAFEILLANNKIGRYDIKWCIRCINPENYSRVIDLICEYNIENSNFDLDLFNVRSILEEVSVDYRELFFDKLLSSLEQKAGNEKIENYSLVELIELFPDGKKLDIFRKLFDLKNKQKIDISTFMLSEIIKVVNDSEKLVFMEFFLANELIEDFYDVERFFNKIPDNLKERILNLFYEYDSKREEKLINEFSIKNIVMSYNEEVRLERFTNLVFEDDRFEDFKVISRITDTDLRFFVLNEKVKYTLSKITEDKRDDFLNNLNNNISIYDNLPNGEVLYLDLINFYVDTFNLNKENFISFIQRFGYVSLKYLDSDNIKKFINLDKVSFDKVMDLFKKDNIMLDNDVINNVVHAILQREFMLQCKEDYNIFSRLEELINSSSFDKVETVLVNIFKVVNVNKILNKYNINNKEFLNNLFNGDKEAKDILHEITDFYIMKKREEYVNSRLVHINEELDLDKKYEKNFIKKKYLATTSLRDISSKIRFNIEDDLLNNEQLELKYNKDAIEAIIQFKKSPKEYKLDDKYKKYLKVFEELLNILYLNNHLKDPTNDPNAKYVYNPKHINEEYLLGIICELDIDMINKFLLPNDKLLGELEQILNKYQLLDWNNTFNPLEKKADFEFDNTTILGIINYFYKISNELVDDDKKFSITKLISLGNCYSSSSSKYGLLYGKDVYRLIAANEGKNKASMVKHKRLELGVSHVINMYKRQTIPIPPIDENIKLDNGKTINVVVGNVTDMKNLVLGELTESCSRIGGAFYDFYKECLEGEVGFNIVLNDPETNQFISRVSGIRNGNTLFLNELRYSVNDKYTNEDCANTIRKISKMLVLQSKSSEHPIENVVITADYAMASYTDELQYLDLLDRKEALHSLHHNLSRDNMAIVLATSKEDNHLVEIKLGKDKISYYKPQRGKIKKYENYEAKNRFIQLKYLNSILGDTQLSEIDMDLKCDIKSCISGDDWIIYIDSQNNINSFIIENSSDKDRAIEEMTYYLNSLDISVNKLESGVIRK